MSAPDAVARPLDAEASPAQPILPMVRPRARTRSSLSESSEGAENPLEILRRHTTMSRDGSNFREPDSRLRSRVSSHSHFAERMQSIIILDFDDTLFPTSYLIDDLCINLNAPLAQQRNLDAAEKAEAGRKIAKCEDYAMEFLRRCHSYAHVVIVTLANDKWVELACRLFYPRFAEVLRSLSIRVVYARSLAKSPLPMHHGTPLKPCDEKLWTELKGRAISESIDEFYSQYPGQSWKNVFSIGDSQFERYGLLAATSAYLKGRTVSKCVHDAFATSARGAWPQSGEASSHKRLRVKCCKLIACPGVNELTMELDLLTRWLQSMVSLDDSFDLDLETIESEQHADTVEAVLRGALPISRLPRASTQASTGWM
eukprot:TRINITY_DN28212_c0_g3_i2.p1 TRINITY_DN28212_c0_g3~~TRINITY_DN28212_c0_g3_i2.p1  ORF type:complete len:371 (+),score=44.86 TRINITY_DN28212_c0_g3_i2:365-1477(+)